MCRTVLSVSHSWSMLKSIQCPNAERLTSVWSPLASLPSTDFTKYHGQYAGLEGLHDQPLCSLLPLPKRIPIRAVILSSPARQAKATTQKNREEAMEDIAIGSPNSYSSSSSSANSLDGRAVVNNTSLQAYLAGQNNNQASSATAESSKGVQPHQQQQKAPKRKKGEKSTTIQTACVYCEETPFFSY